jgi:hypothetical protein
VELLPHQDVALIAAITRPDIGGEPLLSATLRFLGSFLVHCSRCVRPDPIGEAVISNLCIMALTLVMEYRQFEGRALTRSSPPVSGSVIWLGGMQNPLTQQSHLHAPIAAPLDQLQAVNMTFDWAG